MKHRISWLRLVGCISISSLFCAFCIPNIAAHAASPTIVLGEIAWAGSSRSTADEWVELWNLGETDLSIGNWSLGGAADADKKIILPADAIIPAHGTYLISNYANNDAKSTLAIAPNVVTTTIALSNSTLHVVLQDASGTQIDDTGTSTTPTAGASLPIKISMLRDLKNHTWKNATQALNLIGNTTDLATPGYCDDCALSQPEETQTEQVLANQTASTTQEEPIAISTEQQTMPMAETVPPNPITEENPSSTSSSPTISDTTNPIENNSSTASAIASTNPIPENPISSQISSEEVPLPKPAYSMLRLNEFMPSPNEGKEWIEIISLDKGTRISLAGCSLHDTTGKIFTFTNDHQIDPQGNAYLFVELSNAKLNNDGDTLSLYNPDGQLIDTTNYTKSEKGNSYIRYPDMDGNWEISREPTPGTANQRELPEVEIVTSQNTSLSSTVQPLPTSTSTIITAKNTTIPQTSQQKQTPPKETAPPKTNTGIEKKPSKETTTKATKETKPAIPKEPKKAASKTSTKKTTPIYPLTEDMFSHVLEGGIRVSVFGTVASPPGILNAHAFILTNPEGRGLRINLPKKLRLPEQGSAVNVIGKLEFDDQNIPRITVGTNDPLTILKKPLPKAAIKSIDLLAVMSEDAWSYIQTTGTVISATNKTITLDADGIQATISLRAPVSYRGSRLDKGDLIQINGLLDLTGDDPRLIPTKNEDIVLLKRAEKTKSSTETISNTLPQYPTWMPLGAAAGMVVVTEGAKRIKRQRDLKRLEAKLSSL